MADGPTLREIGEHPFLGRLCARIRARRGAATSRLLVPPGDDCAVVAPSGTPLALTTDALVEDVHFRRDWLDWRQLGRRAIAVNLSDLAAMGALPAWTLVAIAAPADFPAHALDATGHDFAACGGEDYELIVACPDEVVARLDALARASATPLTVVGRCVAATDGVVLRDENGRPHAVRTRGFDHFAARTA